LHIASGVPGAKTIFSRYATLRTRNYEREIYQLCLHFQLTGTVLGPATLRASFYQREIFQLCLHFQLTRTVLGPATLRASFYEREIFQLCFQLCLLVFFASVLPDQLRNREAGIIVLLPVGYEIKKKISVGVGPGQYLGSRCRSVESRIYSLRLGAFLR
jgi:hypothetical protein